MAQAPKTLDELFHDPLKDIYFGEENPGDAAQNGEGSSKP
jgi:ferritin-like metal-binding protein YciE